MWVVEQRQQQMRNERCKWAENGSIYVHTSLLTGWMTVRDRSLYWMPLLFDSKLGFSQILDSLLSALWRCSRTFGYSSGESEPIWMKPGALWVHRLRLAPVGFGRDPCRSESWRARRIFGQVNNAWLYRFPIGQISRNLNTTRRSVSRW